MLRGHVDLCLNANKLYDSEKKSQLSETQFHCLKNEDTKSHHPSGWEKEGKEIIHVKY